MNNKTLRKLIKFFTLTLSIGEEGGGSPVVSAGKPAGAAPAEDNIYGKSTDSDAGSDEGAPEGEEPAKDAGETDFTDDTAGEEQGEGGEDQEGQEGQEEQQEEGAQQQAPQPTVLKLDAETIAALRGQNQPARQEPQEEQLTAEQLKKLINPVEITPELVAAIRHEDPATAQQALQQFANATVKNAYSLAKLFIQKKEKEFAAMLNPLRAAHEQAQTQQVRQSFYSSFSHLQKYDKIVRAAAREVNPVNPDGSDKTQEQIFKEVADSTTATLRSLGIVINKPNANPGAGSGVGGGRPVPQPNRLSQPGRSGGDNKNSKPKDDEQADIYRR